MVKSKKRGNRKEKTSKLSALLHALGAILILSGMFGLGIGFAHSLGDEKVDKIVNIGLGGFLGEDKETSFSYQPLSTPISEEEIVENCKDLDLFQTSQCIIQNVATFYRYEITPDNLNLTITNLTERGGDCHDYSMLYESLAIKLGYQATTRTYNGIWNVKAGHRWAMMWNGTHYCKLDLQEVNCYKIKIRNSLIKPIPKYIITIDGSERF